jgi:hypothetical protein
LQISVESVCYSSDLMCVAAVDEADILECHAAGGELIASAVPGGLPVTGAGDVEDVT